MVRAKVGHARKVGARVSWSQGSTGDLQIGLVAAPVSCGKPLATVLSLVIWITCVSQDAEGAFVASPSHEAGPRAVDACPSGPQSSSAINYSFHFAPSPLFTSPTPERLQVPSIHSLPCTLSCATSSYPLLSKFYSVSYKKLRCISAGYALLHPARVCGPFPGTSSNQPLG